MPDGNEEIRPRILIVEDDEGVRASEEKLLSQSGFEPSAVADGPAALELLENESFDLVVLDLDLKDGIDGLEVCRRIKGRPQLAWVPIMFVTGHVSSEVVTKVFEAGGDEFLSKPYKPDELIVRARLLIRKGREERWLIERARTLAEKIAERDDELDDLRRFAQDIVGSLPSALLVLDAERNILFANAPLLDAVQAERRDVLGKKLSAFVKPQSLDGPLGRALDAAAQTGQPSRLRRMRDFLVVRSDRVSDLTVTAIDYAGVRQVLVVMEDVTDQARADEAVARERGKLNDIVNAMNAALCLIDAGHNILWKNRTFGLWFGDTFGQPGLPAFLSKLEREKSWMDAVFARGNVEQMAWSTFTVHGHRRHFLNILAPIKPAPGRPVDQALVLTQDVTESETRVEQLSLLRELSEHLQQTLDAERLNHVILLCVTAGHALGFNRAFLFKRNKDEGILEAQMAVGPGSREEAFRIWGEISSHGHTLHDLLRKLEKPPPKESMPLFPLIKDLKYAIEDSTEIVPLTALEKKPQVIFDAAHDPRVSDHFRRTFGCQEFVAVPMIAKGSVVGVLLADNLYSGRALTDDHVKLLTLFASQAAMAIENADTYAELQMRMSQLRSAQDQIVHSEKLAAVGKMATHVAHEIRNPLSTIGGFARAILKRPDKADRVTRNANVIVEEATRLENMLKGVMDFSRPALPVLKQIDLNAVAEKAVRNHEELFRSQRIVADLDLDRSLPELALDEGQLLQVLQNLIRNAVDSMGQGGALVVKTERQGDHAVLSVTDTGSGIPSDVQDRVFSPFITTKPEGTGLGLAVTKKIVDDHGGRIDFKSKQGSGTTFFIHLPLLRLPGAREAMPPAEGGGRGERVAGS